MTLPTDLARTNWRTNCRLLQSYGILFDYYYKDKWTSEENSLRNIQPVCNFMDTPESYRLHPKQTCTQNIVQCILKEAQNSGILFEVHARKTWVAGEEWVFKSLWENYRVFCKKEVSSVEERVLRKIKELDTKKFKSKTKSVFKPQ